MNMCLSNVTLRGGASGGGGANTSGGGVLSYRGNGRITRPLTSLVLRLQTRQTHGTVLQARQPGSGPRHHLAVFLRRSHLAMELRGAGGDAAPPAVSVRTAGPVADGRWHTVRLRMEKPTARSSRWVVEEDGGGADADRVVSAAAGGSLDFLRDGVDILLGGEDSGGRLDGCLGLLEIGGIPLPFHGNGELTLSRPQEEQFLLVGGSVPLHQCEVEAEAEVEVEAVDTCVDHRCGSGATCLRGAEGYGCICPRNTTGRYCTCEVDVDECASDPCMYGGLCLDRLGGWECACDQNYSGVHCQIDASDFHLYLFLALWQNFFQLLSYLVCRLDDEPEVEWEVQLDD
ncbi:hypothetical protein CRUP_032818 [Coryphaenoides rupestris]|nr:hypothetical protein CRUP_032818 [Coryphaenoides rupestris]